jgi:hypothetical protein
MALWVSIRSTDAAECVEGAARNSMTSVWSSVSIASEVILDEHSLDDGLAMRARMGEACAGRERFPFS